MNPRRARPRPGLVEAILVSALLLGCDSGTSPVQTRWEGILQPLPPATVGGQVAAVTQFGRTEASIHITDAEPDSTYSWRIDAGTCDASGKTQGGVATYPLLTPGASGSAATDAVLAAVFRPDHDFAARVILQGPGGAETVVACGVLEEMG